MNHSTDATRPGTIGFGLLLAGLAVAGCGDGSNGETSPLEPEAPATVLAFTAAPSETELHLPIEPAIEVAAQDTAGETVTTATPAVTLTLGANPGGATLGGTTTVTAEDGVARFEDLSLDRRGSGYTLVASAEGVESAESAPFDIVFRFTAVSAGFEHSCGVTENGIGYCWGRNDLGQLGDGNGGTDADIPVRVQGDLPFRSVRAGGFHTCGVVGDSIFCWGRDDQGQLGDGKPAADSDVPVRVQSESGSWNVATGLNHTCAWIEGFSAHCWGDNEFGQLGDGAGPNDAHAPTAVVPTGDFASSFIAVSAGAGHSCGLSSDGFATCWGSNLFGQLGNGNQGADSDTPVLVQSLSAHFSISAGFNHTCSLRAVSGDGSCWGRNGSGQLGNGMGGTNSDTPSGIEDDVGGGDLAFANVSAAESHTCAVTEEGDAYCWGANAVGQLGDGNAGTSSDVPVPVTGGLELLQVSAGSAHTCGVTPDGLAYCWGSNLEGQLGDGNPGVDSDRPVQVSDPL